MRTLSDVAMVVFTALALFALTFLFMAIPVAIFMWAWNFIVPAIFGLPKITFLGALALTVLLSFLRSAFSFTVRRA